MLDKGETLKPKITVVLLLACVGLFLAACPSGPQHTDPVDKPVPNSSARPDSDYSETPDSETVMAESKNEDSCRS